MAEPRLTRWTVLALVTTVQVTAAFATQGLAALTGAMHDAFGLSGAATGLLVSAVGAAPVVSLFVVGDLVDRHGERWVLAAGSLIMALGLSGAAAAPNYAVVLACLVLAGAGYSTVQPGGSKSISVWFPDHRGVAMGIRQAGLPIGGAVAAAVLPALGWRTAFTLAACVALAGGATFTLIYRAPKTQNRTRTSLLARLIETLREPWLRPILISGVPLVGTQFALTAHLMLFTREHFHRSLSESALLLTVMQTAGVAGRILLAAWSDRTQASRLQIVRYCMAASAAALLFLPVLPPTTPALALAAATAFAGFWSLGWYGPWVAHIADAAPGHATGRALGAAMAANQVAIISLPPLIGLAHDLTHTYRFGWWTLAAALTLTALALSRRRG
ncbi:MFS transporter [Actinomadura barringtoniae]|uniref:MFS transporter n=1 Tax=Actinomadura barringtoniae TaxID=1427535 RepID=A0A939T1B6_9ACTN|nr:MFS transporter [Actinomadura barringtoniae]MBO2447216.1 MFS transporter [Actinomadura barringtoniae]